MAKRKNRAKVPAVGEASPNKHVAHSEPPRGDGFVRFRFDSVDVDGPWCISKITPRDMQDLMRKLRDFETMRVRDAFAPGQDVGKTYDMARCPNSEAKKRLGEFFGGRDNMARLRLTGKQRLFGFLSGCDFSIVWWDPEHEIWPSPKKNT